MTVGFLFFRYQKRGYAGVFNFPNHIPQGVGWSDEKDN